MSCPLARECQSACSHRAKSALLLENASHAFPGSANPSQPISPCKPKCISTISSTCLACLFTSLIRPVHLLLPSQHCQQQLLFLIRLLKSEHGRSDSPPGARGPGRPGGCRLSFALVGALRSFRAVGLR